MDRFIFWPFVKSTGRSFINGPLHSYREFHVKEIPKRAAPPLRRRVKYVKKNVLCFEN